MKNSSEILKEELRSKFQKSPYTVLDELEKVFLDKDSHSYQLLIKMKSNINTLNRERSMGEIDRNTYKNEANKIENNILNLIKEVNEKDANAYLERYTEKSDFLILCRHERRVEDMRLLFPEINFPNTIIFPEEDLDEFDLTKFALVIYDNFPLSPFSSEMPKGLEDLLVQTKDSKRKIYVLFHSPDRVQELHEKYSDRVYFSNSKFSIHSRINEMLLFLRRSSLS